MTNDPLEHLRRLDPARRDDAPPEEIEALLRQIKSDAAPPRGPNRRRPALALAVVLIIVASIAVLVPGREASLSFAARAEAAVTAPADAAVHARLRTTVRGAAGQILRVREEEWWLLPRDRGFIRRVIPNVRSRTPQILVTVAQAGVTKTWSNGRLVQRLPEQLRADRSGLFDPGALFRREYRAGRIRDLGSRTTKNGTRLRRFGATTGNVSIVYDANQQSFKPIRTRVSVQDAGELRPRSVEVSDIDIYQRAGRLPDVRSLLRR